MQSHLLQTIFLALFEQRFTADSQAVGRLTDFVVHGFQGRGNQLGAPRPLAKASYVSRTRRQRSQIFGKIAGLEDLCFVGGSIAIRAKKNDGPFQHIAQFADIARPRIRSEHALRSLAKLHVRTSVYGFQMTQANVRQAAGYPRGDHAKAVPPVPARSNENTGLRENFHFLPQWEDRHW